MSKEALCIDASDFEWSLHEFDKGLLPIGSTALEKIQPRLIDRAVCETDESTLQLLPYNVLTNEKGEVFCYVRGGKGQEDRLHAKLSVGVGGHVDVLPEEGLVGMTLQLEAIREMREEVGVDLSWGRAPKFLKYIVDSTNPVGRVHLGLLSVNEIHSTMLGELEEGMVLDGSWVTLSYLSNQDIYDRLEPWSQMVVDYLRNQNAVCD